MLTYIRGRTRRQVNVPPPWEDWKLDKAFFKSLSDYTNRHPTTTLDRILDNIRAGIDNNSQLFDLIPDSPFPARSLVGALAHLIKLGVTISRAKANVNDFANQVITWVLGIKSAFELSGNGHFTWITWKNLGKMRDLVDEICKWANARLHDKRWSRIGNGMMIANEISEFNARIANARELFKDLTIINLSGGIDAILTGFSLLLNRQDNITREIIKIRKKQTEQFTYIINEMETRKQAEARRLFFSQVLSPRVVNNPTYDQQGKHPCDKDTRTEILAEIMQWIRDISPGSQNFLWLTGDPGCGKSAITASIARECKDDGTLWAQFFINRNSIETTDPNSYFPSIARQLMDQSSDVEHAIYDTLKKKPSLMDYISPDQAANLFLDAIGIASKSYPNKPVVVVIDSLDETDRKCLKDTAIIFSHLFKGLESYPNAKVFVSSRTEDDIRNPFARNMNDKNVKHIHLDTSAQSSINDVTAFLRRKIAQIVEENDLNWAVWPGEERMATLANRASGLFIWAVTVAKFLQEQIDALGTECLDGILDMLTTEVLGDINTLYNLIIRATYKGQANEWEFEKFRRIVGTIVVLREPLCLKDLTGLLNLRQTASSAPVDIVNFVRRLRTVLVSGTAAVDKNTTPRLHKSFFEFITSHEVDPCFRIDLEISNRELAVQCFRQFCDVQLRQDYAVLPGQFRYAYRFWSSHLYQAEGTASGVAIVGHALELVDIQKLFRTSSNDSKLGPLSMNFSSDKSQILMSWDNYACAWDIMDGRKTTVIFKGHTGQVTSVAFSPDGNQVVSGSRDNTLILWDLRTKQPIRLPFKGHTGGVQSVAFSPAGNLIASGSDDETIRLWDVQRFEFLMSLKGHTGPIRSVRFSPDGKIIVSGSDDKSIRLWNAEDGHRIGLPLIGHTEAVLSVAFSPNGDKIASGSKDGTICFWDVHSGQLIGQPLSHPRCQCIWSIAYSPDGKQIVSSYGGVNGTIGLWNTETGQLLFDGPPSQGYTGHVWSPTFSPDGRGIVFGSDSHEIHLLYAHTRQPIIPPFSGHTGAVLSAVFSPNGKQIASASRDMTVRIWDVPESHALTCSEPGTIFTAFSPDGTLVVAATLDNTIKLWDSRIVPPVGQLLQGNVARLRCLAFSSDSTRLAAASVDGAIHLWDITSRELIASSIKDFISRVVSISFAPDNRSFITTYIDETSYGWREENGKLIGIPKLLSPNSGSTFPVAGGYSNGKTDGFHPEDTQWFTEKKDNSFDLRAFVDDHILVARGDGSITIVPVSRSPLKRGPTTTLNTSLVFYSESHLRPPLKPNCNLSADK